MNNNGQSLVEFVIIIAVVVVVGILALTLLGGNINEMFSKSADKTSAYKPFDWGTPATPISSSASTSTTKTSTSSTPASTVNINGVDLTLNTDGTAAFFYGGQDVLLSAADISDMATVTTGSNGAEILVPMIQDMIDKHKDEYPSSDVPIEIMSGKSARTDDSGNDYAYGNEEINLVTVKVGDSFKVFQNDTGGELSGGKFVLEYDAGGGNDIKVTDENGNKVEVPGFGDDGESEIENFATYIDPATGKFYIIGEGEDEPGGSGNDVLSAAGITVPQGLKDIALDCFDKDGKLVDRVWLLEFNPNE